MQMPTLLIFSICALSANFIASEGYGSSMVDEAIEKAKRSICNTIDGTVMDTKACNEYTKREVQEDEDSQAMKLYRIAVAKLSSVLSDSNSAFTQFLTGQKDKAFDGAIDAFKVLKDNLVSAGNDVNSAFSNLGSGQSYVGDAQRWLMSVYNDFMDKLNKVGLADEDFTEEDFEGNVVRGRSNVKEGNSNNENRQDENGNSNEDNEFKFSDIYGGLQEAYERVSQATKMTLEKAYSKVSDLGNEAIKATMGEDDPTEFSSEKAEKAFGNMKQKATDVLEKATHAAQHLAEERFHGGGEEPRTLHSEMKEEEGPARQEQLAEQEEEEAATAEDSRSLKDKAADMIGRAKDAVQNLVQGGIQDFVQGGLQGKDMTTDMFEKAKDAAVGSGRHVKEKAADMVGEAKDAAVGSGRHVKEKAADMVGEAKDAAVGSGRHVKEKAADMVGEAKDAAVGGFSDKKDAATDLLGKAKDAAQHLIEDTFRDNGEKHAAEDDNVSMVAGFEDTILSPAEDGIGKGSNENLETATETIETATSSRFEPERQNVIGSNVEF